jgi:hypothetical protein
MAAMGAGRICVFIATIQVEAEVEVVPVEAVQADEEGIWMI